MEQVIVIRQATDADADTVASILREAADWLTDSGMPMWRADELLRTRIADDVRDGLFFLAQAGTVAAGTIKFQLSDLEFWPDVPDGESAFVHRLAVRRAFAGAGVSSAMLSWAIERAARLGRPYLRLDCEAGRSKLRAMYERLGFEHHSDLRVGPYFVSRYEFRIQ